MDNDKTIKSDVDAIIDRDIINVQQRHDYVDVIKKLRDEKFVPKSETLKAMIGFMELMDNNLNKYLELGLRASINYEAIVKLNKNLEDKIAKMDEGIEDINKMMDNENYPNA